MVKMNYEALIEKKKAKLNKLYKILESTKEHIKKAEQDLNKLLLAKDAEAYSKFKTEIGTKYNVDEIMLAIQNGSLDLSRFVKTNEVEESPHGEDINENEGEEERLT